MYAKEPVKWGNEKHVSFSTSFYKLLVFNIPLCTRIYTVVNIIGFELKSESFLSKLSIEVVNLSRNFLPTHNYLPKQVFNMTVKYTKQRVLSRNTISFPF